LLPEKQDTIAGVFHEKADCGNSNGEIWEAKPVREGKIRRKKKKSRS